MGSRHMLSICIRGIGDTEGTQHTAESLPVGATLIFTVRGVNDAGEGPASPPDQVVVS
jgi:hypothetical protein